MLCVCVYLCRVNNAIKDLRRSVFKTLEILVMSTSNQNTIAAAAKAAPSPFTSNLTDDVTLSGAAMNGFVQGRENVLTFLTTVKALYQDFNVIYHGDTPEFAIEEYTATLEGHAVTGSVTLRKNAEGVYDRIVVNHRPLSSLLLFSSLVSKALEGKIDPNHFYRPEGQSLPELLQYAAANGYR